MRWDGVPIGAFGFFGKPFSKAGRVGDLAPGLGQGLTLFSGHQAGQRFAVLGHQLEPAAQHPGSVFGSAGSPCTLNFGGFLDRLTGFARAQ